MHACTIHPSVHWAHQSPHAHADACMPAGPPHRCYGRWTHLGTSLARTLVVHRKGSFFSSSPKLQRKGSGPHEQRARAWKGAWAWIWAWAWRIASPTSSAWRNHASVRYAMHGSVGQWVLLAELLSQTLLLVRREGRVQARKASPLLQVVQRPAAALLRKVVDDGVVTLEAFASVHQHVLVPPACGAVHTVRVWAHACAFRGGAAQH